MSNIRNTIFFYNCWYNILWTSDWNDINFIWICHKHNFCRAPITTNYINNCEKKYNFNGLKETPTSLQKKKKVCLMLMLWFIFAMGLSSLQDAQPMNVTYNLSTKKAVSEIRLCKTKTIRIHLDKYPEPDLCSTSYAYACKYYILFVKSNFKSKCFDCGY